MLKQISFTVLFTYITAYQVKEHDIKYTLFNRYVTELPLTKNNLCYIDRNEDIKFLVHGKGNSSKPSWIPTTTEFYQQLGNSNIVQVDWTAISGLEGEWSLYKTNDACK